MITEFYILGELKKKKLNFSVSFCLLFLIMFSSTDRNQISIWEGTQADRIISVLQEMGGNVLSDSERHLNCPCITSFTEAQKYP